MKCGKPQSNTSGGQGIFFPKKNTRHANQADNVESQYVGKEDKLYGKPQHLESIGLITEDKFISSKASNQQPRSLQ